MNNAPTLMAGFLLGVAGLFCGCGPASDSATGQNLYARLQNEDPAVRIGAIEEAAKANDRKALPYLVDRLTDTESDVRMFASVALREMTGQDFGWRFYETSTQREAAQQRWRTWLTGGQAPTQPAAETGAPPATAPAQTTTATSKDGGTGRS